MSTQAPPHPISTPVASGPADYPDLAGKVAVVTGGSRGIGAATALALAANRATVVIAARDHATCEATAETIRSTTGTEVLVVTGDCSVEPDVRNLAATVITRFGPPDILAAFAGGRGEPVGTAQESPEHFRAVLDMNLMATFLTVAGFLPAMLDRGSGTVITMASSAGRQAARSNAAYAAAKAGVAALTRHLAGEYAGHGIRFNCIAPSAIENDQMRQYMTEQQRAQLGAQYPLGRIGQPIDIAAATVFLASDQAGWITGVTLDVAGGKVML